MCFWKYIVFAKAKQGVCLALYTFENMQDAFQLLSPAAAFMYMFTLRRKGVSDVERNFSFLGRSNII